VNFRFLLGVLDLGERKILLGVIGLWKFESYAETFGTFGFEGYFLLVLETNRVVLIFY